MVRRALFQAVLLWKLALPALAVVHEQLGAVPNGWKQVSTPDANTVMTFTVALSQQNLDQLESKLYAVSTPGSADYGKHLDINDVNTLFPPTNATAVLTWLQSAGISNIHSAGSSIHFVTKLAEANKLLNTTFAYYRNGNTQKLRTTKYSVPNHLAEYIDLISPTTYFGKIIAAVAIPAVARTEKRAEIASQPSVAASCQTSITPACLKQMYNINYQANAKSGSRIGFGSFLNQSALYSDLAMFESYFHIPAQNFSVELINGGVNNQNPATAQVTEADLDVECIIGISHPLPVTEFITGGSPPFVPNLDEPTPASNQNEPYIPYYEYLLSRPNSQIPQVISNSYGDDEQTVPLKYAKRVCNLIGLLGLRGVTVLTSSGDVGVGGPCQSNDGKKTPQFTPQFPGTCPYVTTVGGTQNVSPEIAWPGSSGGFSNYFPRPRYQDTAIETYLNKRITPAAKAYYAKYANFPGRGFPDVSAHSLTPAYEVFYTGSLNPSGGTSAATPVVAGIIALLNDARLRAQKPPLGFINPLLYGILAPVGAIRDIVGGGSVGCFGINIQSGAPIPGASFIPYAMWNATIGWDPVTGLGTPDFGALRDIILDL